MTDYEVTYILRPGLEESEVETRANAIAEIVKSQGGELVGMEKLGRKRLAYEIDDVREGNYVVMQFKSSAEASKELERQLKLHEDVLRALVVRLDKKMIAHMAAVAAATPPPPV
jgi:small subunit ribosomal protein S6